RVFVTGSGPAAFLHETGRRSVLLGLAANLRETFTEWLSGRTDRETASLLTAMVLGDRSMLSDETENDFRRSGLSHLMAVSGLHVTLLFAWISKAARAPKGKAAVLRSLALLALYGWICAFSPSVVRGILMIVIRKAADLLHRRYDLLTAIGVSATLSALANPFSIVQTGFLLSYGAVLSLALVLPAIEAKTEAKLRLEMPFPKRVFWETARLTGASAAIAVGMAPLQLLLFQQFTPAALVLNVPAIALAGIVMPLGFLLFVYANVAGAGGFLSAVPLFVERVLLLVLRFFAKVGSFFTVRAGGVSTVFVALFTGLGMFFAGEWFRMNRERDRRRVKVALALTALIVTTLGILADDGIGGNALCFVDVGQGDCLHIHERALVRDGESGKRSFASVDFLIDGGGSATSDIGGSTILPYLLSQGVTHLDGVLATHLHTDHFKGLAEVCRETDVGGLIVFSGNRPREAELLEATGLDAERIVYVAAGDTVTLSPDVSLEILWPAEPEWADGTKTVLAHPERYEDENESSLIVRVRFKGLACLVTADIDSEGEAALLAADTDLAADVLKVAHHGSRFSSSGAFLRAVSPQAAVIQVGAYNSYGHPAPSTVEKLEAYGIMIYRNDRNGAVTVHPARNGFRVRTVRKDIA
ncbi:MAG: DNA internalization-related competence protein ComEC/Rec2, partial [Firmicutes bacterium]|nr:DNA internalization-related competence protein ComEC/Rec2 [Bacillota bacterium]